MSTSWLEPLERIATSIGAARALPAECYRDPDFYREEVERIMRREWHAVARSDELREVGDYRSVDVYGEPLLLVRDAARQLRAFSRVCLHRAFVFAQGDGNAKRFTCPYHRWAYDLDGRLRAAPLAERIEGFDRSACRLPELPVEIWQGFVTVNLDAAASPLAPRLRPLQEKLAPFHYDELRHVSTLDFDSPWNWKVMVENFIESYHHLGPHVDNLQRSNPAAGTYAEPLEGPFVLLENPGVEGAEPFWVGVVFPDLLFTLSRGEQPWGVWYELRVDSHEHFLLRIHLLASEGLADDERFTKGIPSILDAVHRQDIEMCEGVQHGIRSRLWQPGRLHPLEETVWRFHCYLAERMLGREQGFSSRL